MSIRMTNTVTFIVMIIWAATAQAESVEVKYRGSVELRPFTCSDVSRSSFVERVCYDKANQYMIIRLWTTFNGDRGTKSKPVPGPHQVYGFLTTSPNAVVEPIHPKAMPVIAAARARKAD